MGKEKTPLSILIQYLGPLVVFMGAFRLLVYYRVFNVNIISFIQFEEVLTSFLEIIPFLIYITITILVIVLSGRKRDSFMTFKRNLVLFRNKRLMTIWLKVEYYLLQVILCILTVIYVCCFILYWEDYFYYLAILAAIIVLGGAELIVKNLGAGLTHNNMIRPDFAKAAIRVFYVYLIIYGMAIIEAQMVRDYNLTDKVSITLDDGSIIYSNQEYYYIGKTSEYVFIYSELQNSTQVIPTHRVKEYSFPAKPGLLKYFNY